MSSHQHRWKLDRNLIPLKAHYFLQSAGLGAIWPFLPVLGRQLGISPFAVGLTFGIATLSILLVKPFAKLFKNQKTVFLVSTFLVVVALLSFTIFPQPDISATRPVEFECGEGSNYIKQCRGRRASGKNFLPSHIHHEPLVCPTPEQRSWIEGGGDGSTAKSKHVPNYIEEDQLRYKTLLAEIHNLPTQAGVAGSKSKSKRAAAAVEIPDKTNEAAAQKPNATATIRGNQPNSTTRCYISCEGIDFSHLEQFCGNFLGTKNISAELCTALYNMTESNQTIGDEMRKSVYQLYFETKLKIERTQLVDDECLFLPIDAISFKSLQRINADEVRNATLTRNVDTFEPDQLPFEQFSCLPNETVFKNCFANCLPNAAGIHLNAYLEVYSPAEHELFSTEIRFWFYVILALMVVTGLGIVNSMNDSICYQLVHDNPDKFGLQKLWAVAGYGLFCVCSGYFIDRVSESKIAKDYAPCFFLIAGLFTLDFVISFRFEIKPPPKYQNLWRDSIALLKDPRISLFVADCVVLGACFGIHQTYLLWYIEELNEKKGCAWASDWIRTLQGLLVLFQCASEILFFGVAGWLLNKFGYFNCTSLILLMSSVQYAMYALLSHPWSFVPLEVFHGIIFSIFFSTMINYGSVVVNLSGRQNSPRVKQFFTIAFSIIGVSTGAILGGYLFEEHGGQMLFAIVAVSCLILCFIHIALVFLVNKNIEYGQPIAIIANTTTTSTNEQKLKRISRSDSQEFHFDFESDIE